MSKLKLIPNPTFVSKVGIPVPGTGSVDVQFTFKHRTRDEMQRFIDEVNAEDEAKRLDDTQLVMGCASGWELTDTFDAKNVEEFCRQYIAGPAAVFETYCAELTGARLKNSNRPRL